MSGQRLSSSYDRRSGLSPFARTAFGAVTWLFVAGLVVQVFIAGLGVFESSQRSAVHRDFGYLLGFVSLALLILALVGRLPRRVVLLAALLLVLIALQSVFVVLRSSQPLVASLHPLNGFLMLFVAITVARSGRSGRDANERY